MKILILFLGFLFLLLASRADTGELYRWVDQTGKVHIVDELSKVPESRRDQIKVYNIPERPSKEPPAQKTAVSEPTPPISESQAQPEPSTRAAEEKEGRAEFLRRKMAELEQTIAIARAQERRFNGARATLYKKKKEEATEELQAVKKELDAIQSEIQ